MRKMRKLAIYLVLALVTTFCLTGMALASSIDLAETGVNYAAVVNITGPSGSGITNQGVYAGLYQLLIGNPSGSPLKHFDAYCVDPQFSPTGVQQYDLQSIAIGSPNAAVAWILKQDYTTLAPEAQVAAWMLTWPSFTLNSGFDATQLGQVQSIHDAALAANFDPVGYSLAHNGINQDYVIHNPVPIPPTVLLFGSGVLGIVGLGWRRKRQNGV